MIQWTCSYCGSRFDPMGGGKCKSCGKVTCNSCFGIAKLKLLFKMKMPESRLCRVCAEKKE